MSGWSIIFVAIIIAILCVLGFIFAPKSDNQTVWRYSIILTLVSCYLLWAITYLAQLHPLIEPRASKLRPDIVHGETF